MLISVSLKTSSIIFLTIGQSSLSSPVPRRGIANLSTPFSWQCSLRCSIQDRMDEGVAASHQLLLVTFGKKRKRSRGANSSYNRYNNKLLLLNGFPLNGHTSGYIVSKDRTNLCNVNRTIGKYCSVASIWTVTLQGFHPQTQKSETTW